MRVKRSFSLVLPIHQKTRRAYQWLRDALRGEILRGTLKPGQRIPSTRELASQYGLSRGTVLSAIDDLRSEGYLFGVAGSGTFVCQTIPEDFSISRVANAHSASTNSILPPKLSSFGQRVKPFEYFIAASSLAFRTNLPALDLFPTLLWAQTASRRTARLTTSELLGCRPHGLEELRKSIAQYLSESRGVRCEPEQIVVVSGIQEAMDLVARILVNPGDRVLIEDPGYQAAYTVFRAAGAKLVSIAVDRDGANPERSDFQQAKLLYVTPSHQFPTGATMPLSRRVELLSTASQNGTFIFEDDHDSEYRYSGSPLPAMQGLDAKGLVIFAGSFNKVLFPALRMGYMVLPPNLLEVFKRTKAMTTRHHSILDQVAMCDFMEQGHFGRHLRRTRKIYAERYRCLSAHVAANLKEVFKLSNIEAGLQTIGWLEEGLNAREVSQSAARLNVDVIPLSNYLYRRRMPEALQVGFAAVDETAIEAGTIRLAEAIRLCRAGSFATPPSK